MRIRCRKCGAEWEHRDRIGVRDDCPECAAYLHACVNCGHYDARLSACRLSTTEPVADRAGQNFCEEFVYGEVPEPSEGEAAAPKASRSSPEDARRRFEDLFRDAGS